MTSISLLPLERDIEARCVRYAESQDWLSIKLDLASRDWPDRLFIGPSSQYLFVEFKRPGKKARKRQAIMHRRLRERGHPVSVIVSYEQFFELLSLSSALAVEGSLVLDPILVVTP